MRQVDSSPSTEAARAQNALLTAKATVAACLGSETAENNHESQMPPDSATTETSTESTLGGTRNQNQPTASTTTTH